MSYEKMRALLEKVISQFGMAVQPIAPSAESPPFSYSIGQHAKGLPELIVFGMPPPIAASLLYELAEYMEDEQAAGRTVGPGTVKLEGCEMPGALVEVPTAVAAEYATAAHDRSEGKATLIQVVWPDKEGRFPWQPGYDKRFLRVQRVIGAPPTGAPGTSHLH